MLIYEHKKSGELITEKQYMKMLKEEYQNSSKDVTFKEYLENDLYFNVHEYNHLIDLDSVVLCTEIEDDSYNSVLIQYKGSNKLQIKILSKYDTSVLLDYVEQIINIPQSYLMEINTLVSKIKTLLEINPLG